MTTDMKCLYFFQNQEIRIFSRTGIALLISTQLTIKGQHTLIKGMIVTAVFNPSQSIF